MPEPLECFFLGTGTSTGLPLTPCLTLTSDYPPNNHASSSRPTTKGTYDPRGAWPKNVKCGSCRAAVDIDVPEGWKNRRGNTSMVVRKKVKEGKWFNVVLDVGKTFRENAAKFFPVWGVKTIDAVILTHGHADAFFGMDDLREWCIRQGCSIPVYLNRPTYDTVAGAFPYMVDKSQASGGGDVPSLIWNIIEDDDDFDIAGINVRSFTTHHGIYFRQPEEKGSNKPPKPLPKQLPTKKVEPRPLVCLGFVFDSSMVYMGDVSNVPDKSWKMLKGLRRKDTTTRHREIDIVRQSVNETTSNGNGAAHNVPARTSLEASLTNSVLSLDLSHSGSSHSNGTFTPTSQRPLILIIDSLWPIRTHTSHYNFPQALAAAMELDADMTYLLGFTHPTSHFQWEELCLSIRDMHGKRDDHPDADVAKSLIGDVWRDGQFRGEFGQKLKKWAGRVEPAWDGLKLEVASEGWSEVETRSVSL